MTEFFKGQRLVLAVSPLSMMCLGTPLTASEQLTTDTIYHFNEYAPDLSGEKMLTLKETGTTQYLARFFRAEKRKRLDAVCVRPKRSVSARRKV